MTEQIELVQAKNSSEIHNIEDILGDFTGFTLQFPIDAVMAAVERKLEITPKLLKILKDSVDHFDDVDNFSHVYAMFLLAEFKEKQAFPIMLEFILKADDNFHELLTDSIECYIHNIMASVFDGNLDAIKRIIEDSKCNLWALEFCLDTILVLSQQKVLNKETSLSYLNGLFNHPRFEKGSEAFIRLTEILKHFTPENDWEYEFIESATEDLASLFPFEEDDEQDDEEVEAHTHIHGPGCSH